MKIILIFYDNFTRDFRGLLFLKNILENYNNVCYLKPLWNNAIHQIKRINPSIVVMGQIGEYSTSRIGKFCHDNNIALCINSTEFVESKNKIKYLFKFNRTESSEKYIVFQTLGGEILKNYIYNSEDIEKKDKYKLVGIPRMDLNTISEFRNLEISFAKDKYQLNNKKVYLYISDFIFDDSGGQIDKENEEDSFMLDKKNEEIKVKNKIIKILNEFMKYYLKDNDVLLIKKHPWDKSKFFENNIVDNEKIVILQNSEYITPMLMISDFIIHYESTVAIEAWMVNKKTISLHPLIDQKQDDDLKYHMEYEVNRASNCDELIYCIENYKHIDRDDFLRYFNYKMDGGATIRLAKEIMSLKLSKEKNNLSVTIKDVLKEKINGLRLKYFNNKYSETYGYLLNSFEKERPRVEKKYNQAFNLYIKNNLGKI